MNFIRVTELLADLESLLCYVLDLVVEHNKLNTCIVVWNADFVNV